MALVEMIPALQALMDEVGKPILQGGKIAAEWLQDPGKCQNEMPRNQL